MAYPSSHEVTIRAELAVGSPTGNMRMTGVPGAVTLWQLAAR